MRIRLAFGFRSFTIACTTAPRDAIKLLDKNGEAIIDDDSWIENGRKFCGKVARCISGNVGRFFFVAQPAKYQLYINTPKALTPIATRLNTKYAGCIEDFSATVRDPTKPGKDQSQCHVFPDSNGVNTTTEVMNVTGGVTDVHLVNNTRAGFATTPMATTPTTTKDTTTVTTPITTSETTKDTTKGITISTSETIAQTPRVIPVANTTPVKIPESSVLTITGVIVGSLCLILVVIVVACWCRRRDQIAAATSDNIELSRIEAKRSMVAIPVVDRNIPVGQESIYMVEGYKGAGFGFTGPQELDHFKVLLTRLKDKAYTILRNSDLRYLQHTTDQNLAYVMMAIAYKEPHRYPPPCSWHIYGICKNAVMSSPNMDEVRREGFCDKAIDLSDGESDKLDYKLDDYGNGIYDFSKGIITRWVTHVIGNGQYEFFLRKTYTERDWEAIKIQKDKERREFDETIGTDNFNELVLGQPPTNSDETSEGTQDSEREIDSSDEGNIMINAIYDLNTSQYLPVGDSGLEDISLDMFDIQQDLPLPPSPPTEQTTNTTQTKQQKNRSLRSILSLIRGNKNVVKASDRDIERQPFDVPQLPQDLYHSIETTEILEPAYSEIPMNITEIDQSTGLPAVPVYMPTTVPIEQPRSFIDRIVPKRPVTEKPPTPPTSTRYLFTATPATEGESSRLTVIISTGLSKLPTTQM